MSQDKNKNIPPTNCPQCGNTLDSKGICNDCLYDDEGLTEYYMEGLRDKCSE